MRQITHTFDKQFPLTCYDEFLTNNADNADVIGDHGRFEAAFWAANAHGAVRFDIKIKILQ